MCLTSRHSARRNAYLTGISLRTIFRNVQAGARGFSRCLTVRLICPSRSNTNHISERITAKPNSKENTRTAVFRDVVHARKSVIDLELFSIPHLRAYPPHHGAGTPACCFRAIAHPEIRHERHRFIFLPGCRNPDQGRGGRHRFAPTRLLHFVGLLDCYIVSHVGDKPINAVVGKTCESRTRAAPVSHSSHAQNLSF